VTPQAPLTGSGCREHSYGGFGGGHPRFHTHTVLRKPDLCRGPLIHRSGHIVQDRPVVVMCWVDIPGLSARLPVPAPLSIRGVAVRRADDRRATAGCYRGAWQA
jgi:hypothetical protein